jgi:hypothetical protein
MMFYLPNLNSNAFLPTVESKILPFDCSFPVYCIATCTCHKGAKLRIEKKNKATRVNKGGPICSKNAVHVLDAVNAVNL